MPGYIFAGACVDTPLQQVRTSHILARMTCSVVDLLSANCLPQFPQFHEPRRVVGDRRDVLPKSEGEFDAVACRISMLDGSETESELPVPSGDARATCVQ